MARAVGYAGNSRASLSRSGFAMAFVHPVRHGFRFGGNRCHSVAQQLSKDAGKNRPVQIDTGYLIAHSPARDLASPPIRTSRVSPPDSSAPHRPKASFDAAE